MCRGGISRPFPDWIDVVSDGKSVKKEIIVDGIALDPLAGIIFLCIFYTRPAPLPLVNAVELNLFSRIGDLYRHVSGALSLIDSDLYKMRAITGPLNLLFVYVFKVAPTMN